MSGLAGVIPVAHTPWAEDDTIDWPSFERQLDWAFQAGADGCCTGMVSEWLRLTYQERLEVTERLCQLSQGRGAAVISVGAESTRQAVQYAEAAAAAGAAGVMAIPPVTTAVRDVDLGEYFRAIAAVGLPVIVQDASSYVGRSIPLEVCRQLLDELGPERVLFKPEAAPLGPNLSALRDATDGRARIFEGSGGLALVDCHRRGIVGAIPGMEFLPAVVALWRALERGDEETVYRIYFPLCALVALQMQAGLDGFLAVEKHILHQRGLFTTERRRRPYQWELDDETRAEIDRLLRRLEAAL